MLQSGTHAGDFQHCFAPVFVHVLLPTYIRAFLRYNNTIVCSSQGLCERYGLVPLAGNRRQINSCAIRRTPPELSSSVYQSIFTTWVSCTGYLVAEILAKYQLGELSLHSFSNSTSTEEKRSNWLLIQKYAPDIFWNHDTFVLRAESREI